MNNRAALKPFLQRARPLRISCPLTDRPYAAEGGIKQSASKLGENLKVPQKLVLRLGIFAISNLLQADSGFAVIIENGLASLLVSLIEAGL